MTAAPLGHITDLRTADNYYPDTPLCRRVQLQDAARELLPPGSRVQYCMRRRVDDSEPVDIVCHPDEKRASYTNLMVCGNKWLCPVCGAYHAEQERELLQHGLDIWHSRGYQVVMATFTLRHKAWEPCQEVLTGLLDSFSAFWRYREGRNIGDEFNIVGRVRGLEVTQGQNGWHAHIHCLLFIERDVITKRQMARLQDRARKHWLDVLNRHKRTANREIGLEITYGQHLVAAYVAKFGKDWGDSGHYNERWTVAHETAKGATKANAGKENRTPNGLLNDYLWGDDHAGHLWLEYAEAFKGKSILRWSKGLKDYLGLDDYISALPVEPPKQAPFVIARLPFAVWKQVLYYEIVAELIDIAGTGDQGMIRHFLSEFDISTADIEWPTIPDLTQFILEPARAGPQPTKGQHHERAA